MGRGVSELIVYGEYRMLDLSSLSVRRLVFGTPVREVNVI